MTAEPVEPSARDRIAAALLAADVAWHNSQDGEDVSWDELVSAFPSDAYEFRDTADAILAAGFGDVAAIRAYYVAEIERQGDLLRRDVAQAKAERDAAIAVITKAQTLYANTDGPAEDLAWMMWVALDQQWSGAAR